MQWQGILAIIVLTILLGPVIMLFSGEMGIMDVLTWYGRVLVIVVVGLIIYPFIKKSIDDSNADQERERMKRAEDSARIWSKIESQKTEKEAHDKLLESMKHEIRFETPAQLERLAAVIWEKMGFVIEQQAQGGPDEGIDVLAFKSAPFPQRVLIQCKLHDKPIGVSTVREYGALRNRSGIDDVVIIAPSGFTEPALKEADELKVKLIDKSVLNELIDEHFSGRKSSLEW